MPGHPATDTLLHEMLRFRGSCEDAVSGRSYGLHKGDSEMSDRNRNAVLRTAIVLAMLACSGCGGGGTSAGNSTDLGYRTHKVQAFLVQPDAHWRRGSPLRILLVVWNGTSKPVRMDGRMEWPGNITLWARLPSGKKIPVSRMMVKLTQPSRSSIMQLPPSGLYGRELRVTGSRRDISEEIRHPALGRYEFWAEFYSCPNSALALKPLSLTTNSVSVEVR